MSQKTTAGVSLKVIILGVLFAAFWASASVAAKIGIRSVEPLVLFNIRFFIAGILLLGYATFVEKQPLPKGIEWRNLTIFGLLNTTIYLSLFVLAIRTVAAGIGSLSTATNPLLISILSAFWIGRKIKTAEWFAIILGIIGVGIATYPLLQNSYADATGLLILSGSMISYSVATIFFSNIQWRFSRSAINGWQALIGGILLIPFTYFSHSRTNNFDLTFWLSELWLSIPVSIVAIQLWLYLLKIDAVKASFFLFLCPIFGFIYSSLLLDEPISFYTLIGTALVLVGLYIGQRKK
ncbi:MAG: DMT family transporter [Spirosomaceae bacterium]|jgi:drug/metabolite transporter (DMT)-like permease|nr:DMT family transporter [Spirosomataceae bacterium]